MNCADLNYHVTAFYDAGSPAKTVQLVPLLPGPWNWVFKATVSVENESKRTVNRAEALTWYFSSASVKQRTHLWTLLLTYHFFPYGSIR